MQVNLKNGPRGLFPKAKKTNLFSRTLKITLGFLISPTEEIKIVLYRNNRIYQKPRNLLLRIACPVKSCNYTTM